MTTATYANGLRGPFTFDSIEWIAQNQAIIDRDVLGLFRQYPLRFVAHVTFLWNFAFGRFDTYGYHVVSVVFHYAASLALFAFCSRLWRLERAGQPADAAPLPPVVAAFLVAAVFVTHPLNTSATDYLIQRSVLMCTGLYLGALYCFIVSQSAPARAWLWQAAALACGVLAQFCKQSAITLPAAVALLYALYLRPRDTAWLSRRTLKTLLPYGLLVAVPPLTMVLFPDPAVQELKGSTAFVHFPLSVQLLSTPRPLLDYLALILWPTGLHFERDVLVETSPWAPGVLLPCLAHLALLAAAVACRRRAKLITFGIVFYYLTFFLEMALVPLEDVYAEHRAYLPAVGILIAVLALVEGGVRRLAPATWRLPGDRATLALAVCCLLCTPAVLASQARNDVWGSREELLLESFRLSPTKKRVPLNLAAYYIETKEYDKVAYYANICLTDKFGVDEAIFADKAHYDLGLVYANTNRHREAIGEFDKAAQLNPDGARYWFRSGLSHASLGELDAAKAAFAKAVELNPTNYEFHLYLARALVDTHHVDEAAGQFNEAIKALPANVIEREQIAKELADLRLTK